MTFVYLHEKIRNDEHCPICRQYYISLHISMEDAYKYCSVDLSNNDELIDIV